MRGIIQKSPGQKSWALTGSEILISQCSWQERVICLILHIFPAMGIFLTYLINDPGFASAAVRASFAKGDGDVRAPALAVSEHRTPGMGSDSPAFQRAITAWLTRELDRSTKDACADTSAQAFQTDPCQRAAHKA